MTLLDLYFYLERLYSSSKFEDRMSLNKEVVVRDADRNISYDILSIDEGITPAEITIQTYTADDGS